jgi:hypothetical protein
MTWLVWRQYRAQGAIAAALLAAAAAVILADGFQIASHWHSILVRCSGNSTCLQQQSALVNGVVSDLPYISLIVPAVLGMLWGAPLVAHELEARTSDFAWTQSVTRTHWLTVKAGWLLLAAAACSGAITALTTWWSGPDNARFASAFEPGHFDTQGIVPVEYAVFAMALGIAAGTVARRTLPAIAVVLGGFIARHDPLRHDGRVHAARAGLGARPGRRQPDRAGGPDGMGRPVSRAPGLLPTAASRDPRGEVRRFAERRVLLHARSRLARVRHLSARQPLLAVPGHRDRDLPPAGRGADRGHVRHHPPPGRIADGNGGGR